MLVVSNQVRKAIKRLHYLYPVQQAIGHQVQYSTPSIDDRATDSEVDSVSRQFGERWRNAPASVVDEAIELYGPRLRRLIGSLTAWNAETDDILQETFIRAWQRAHTFRAESTFESWLCSIAVRTCRNHYRASHRLAKHLQQLWSIRTQSESCVGRISEPVHEKNPLWDEIQEGMKQLPHADRELLVLAYLEQWPVERIAVELGASHATIHTRLHRARERLKKLVKVKT